MSDFLRTLGFATLTVIISFFVLLLVVNPRIPEPTAPYAGEATCTCAVSTQRSHSVLQKQLLTFKKDSCLGLGLKTCASFGGHPASFDWLHVCGFFLRLQNTQEPAVWAIHWSVHTEKQN